MRISQKHQQIDCWLSPPSLSYYICGRGESVVIEWQFYLIAVFFFHNSPVMKRPPSGPSVTVSAPSSSRSNVDTEKELAARFNVDTYPRILFWATEFPRGLPRFKWHIEIKRILPLSLPSFFPPFRSQAILQELRPERG